MKIRGPVLAAALLATVGCGDDTTGLEDVASITLTPESISIDVGLSVQFTAQAYDSDGALLPDIAFTWSSSDTLVGTVNENGLAQALSIGTTAITASAGSATPASQVLIVEPSSCVGRVDVVLDAGQYQSYGGDQCLFLPSGALGDRYRIAVSRPTLIADPLDVPDVWLEINPILTTAQGSAPARSTASAGPVGSPRSSVARGLLDGTRFLEDRVIMAHTRRFHAELREREQSLGLRTRPLSSSAPARAMGPSLVDPPARDDLFLVLTCDAGATRTPVQLVNFNDDVVIYQDSVENASTPLSQSATDLMLDYYSSYVRDLIPQYWGTTPDIDGNQRVIVTTSNALPDSAAAGVFSGDFRSSGDCASSNEGEVMYFATDVITAMDDADPSYLALSVMAHEMKHVTSLYHGVARGAFHTLWIEEGSAEISQTMSSRVAWAATGGPAIGDRIDGNDIIDGVDAADPVNRRPSPEMWGVISQIADLIVYLSSQPNSLITNPSGSSEFHTFYSAGWHWHRFMGDAFGGAATPYADGPLFVEMTDSRTPAGSAAHAQVTGKSFADLFEDLIVAMSYHAVGPEPPLSFTTWDLASTTSIFASPPEVAPPGDYPWPVTMSPEGVPTRGFGAGTYSCPPRVGNDGYELAPASARCPIGPSGVRFHDFVSDGSGAGAQVLVLGAADGKLTVTRLR